MEEISLGELLGYIRKNILFVILFTLLCGAVTFGVNKFLITPEYESSTSMIIGKPKEFSSNSNNQQIEYNDVMVNQKLVSTYSEIVKSRGIANYVIDNLGLDMDYKEFSSKVSVAAVKDTEVMAVKVKDTIPERAKDIANSISEVFKDSIKEIMSIDNVQILDAAELPQHPISPRTFINTAIALILGLFVSIFISIFKELTDNSIKTAEEITELFNVPVLGIIPIKKGEENIEKNS